MQTTLRCLALFGALISLSTPSQAHQGVVVAHSPFNDAGAPPCPTLDPLKLYLLQNEAIGGPITDGEAAPASAGEATLLTRLATADMDAG